MAQGKAGTASGTSVAAAKVAGAASLVWAVNPQLNYNQVIDVLKRTATDLNIPNWDSKTGVGLLNIASATYLAEATEPEPYIPLGLKLLQDSFETLGVPENDQQTLQELYYYFDLEAKLVGSDWNSIDATASERPDFLEIFVPLFLLFYTKCFAINRIGKRFKEPRKRNGESIKKSNKRLI